MGRKKDASQPTWYTGLMEGGDVVVLLAVESADPDAGVFGDLHEIEDRARGVIPPRHHQLPHPGWVDTGNPHPLYQASQHQALGPDPYLQQHGLWHSGNPHAPYQATGPHPHLHQHGPGYSNKTLPAYPAAHQAAGYWHPENRLVPYNPAPSPMHSRPMDAAGGADSVSGDAMAMDKEKGKCGASCS